MLCAVWPSENWLGSSMNHIQGLRMLQACFRKRMSGGRGRRESQPRTLSSSTAGTLGRTPSPSCSSWGGQDAGIEGSDGVVKV